MSILPVYLLKQGPLKGLFLGDPPQGLGYPTKVLVEVISNSIHTFSWVLVTVQSKFTWDINLKMRNYDLPKGMSPNDYVTFESILTELKLAHQNKNLLDHMSSELTRNTNEDWWVRVGCLITTAIASGALILSRIKKLRDILKWKTSGRDQLGTSGTALPMFQAHLT